MKKKRTKKLFKAVVSTVLVGSVMGTGMASTVASADSVISSDGKYYTDYETYSEALDAANDVGYEVASEGTTLLKNNNEALPLNSSARVSLFGVASDSLAGASNGYLTLGDALTDEGFRVNPQLASYYGSVETTIGNETMDFNNSVKQSMGVYNDAAIVVISREGGEGFYADNDTVTDEEADDANENVDGWEHLALHTSEGKTYKHFMQFTDSEVELLNYVKSQGFKKIIYLINSTVPMEVYNIENDDAVDGIVWVGRPGQIGAKAIAQILSGEINPSGKTADTWYTDFTADPTWYNFGDNMQSNTVDYDDSAPADLWGGFLTYSNSYKDEEGNATNYCGIDYEEDIYLGYRYYETKAADMNTSSEGTGTTWYNKAVTYPFGYGLSYTTFAFSGLTVTMDNGAEMKGALDSSLFASTATTAATVKTATATITVKNTGSVAGKETVQVYVTAPYTSGEVEKPYEVLVGYAKTDLLKPGQQQQVKVTFNIQDFASYDYTDANNNNNKGYELDDGSYTIHVTNNAHGWAETDSKEYEKQTFSLSSDAIMKQDDYSGAEVYNLFSSENGMYYSLRDNSDASKYNFNADSTAGEVLMTRAGGFVLPQSPSVADMTISAAMLKSLQYWDGFTVDKEGYADGKEIAGSVDTDDYPWLLTDAQKAEMTDWDQTATYTYKMSDMTGLDFNDNTTIIASGVFKGKTPYQAWQLFMNTLSWSDLQQLVATWQQQSLDSISMNAVVGSDSSYNYASTFGFPDNTVLAATWNSELAELEGRTIGNLCLLKGNNTWWGGATQVHRSYFAGRVDEYMSEDSFLAGSIGSHQIRGAQSKGMVCYVKHCVLNDQETNRAGYNVSAWISEQALREIYLKPFQMCVQEGEAQSVMGAYARIGRVCINNNYNLITKLFREQWGLGTINFASDNYIMMNSCVPLDLAVRAGSDNFQPGSLSGTWDATNKQVLVGSGETKTASAEQYYYVRTAAMRFLWVHANSSINQNGIDLSTWKGSDVALTQGTTANSNLGITIAEASSVKYTIVDGSLPTGVTLTEDGKLTGKPTVAGDYTIKVTCVADNWINATRVFNIKVASAFTVDTTTGTVGDEDFYLAISSDTVQVTNQQTQSLTYTLVDGKLPDGLTLNADGSIEGTPTTAGVYDLTFRIDLSEQSGGGGYRPSQTTVTSYEYKVTLTIADAEKDEEDVVLSISSMEIDSEGQQLVLTLSDGQTVNVALATNDTDSGEEDAVLSITSMEVDSDGQLVLTLSDGQMVNTGLTASDTEIKAIKNVEINSDGELVLTFNDDTTSNLGKVVGANGTDGTPGASVTGEKGDKGDKGDAGETVNATAGLVLAIVALVAALAAGGVVVYVLLKKKN